jgi:hypothetical protein
MQPDELDHRPDLRLGTAQPKLAVLDPQATGEGAEVEHQGRVRKREFRQIDNHVSLRPDRSCERLPAVTLGRPVLVASTAQRRGGVIEADDPGNLHNDPAGGKGESSTLLH